MSVQTSSTISHIPCIGEAMQCRTRTEKKDVCKCTIPTPAEKRAQGRVRGKQRPKNQHLLLIPRQHPKQCNHETTRRQVHTKTILIQSQQSTTRKEKSATSRTRTRAIARKTTRRKKNESSQASKVANQTHQKRNPETRQNKNKNKTLNQTNSPRSSPLVNNDLGTIP
jgi:hypothetical protein